MLYPVTSAPPNESNTKESSVIQANGLSFGSVQGTAQSTGQSATTSPQQANPTAPVSLTLYVHEGSASGSTIPGAQVTSNDNSGNSFHGTTNANGYVTIVGIPGTWSFTASAPGYVDNPWSQQITGNIRKDAYLQKVPSGTVPATSQHTKPVTLILYVDDGSASGSIISGAQVTAQDGSGNSFQETTGSSGSVIISGTPGTWSFSASASGYETNSWSQSIVNSCAKHAFLKKVEKQEVTEAAQEMCQEYPAKCLDLVYQPGKMNEAVACYQEDVKCKNQAISQNPNNPDYWYDKGNALDFLASYYRVYTHNEYMSLYEDAIKAFDRAIELNPPSDEVACIQREKEVVMEDMKKVPGE